MPADGFTAVVAERLSDQVAVLIEIFYPFGQHSDWLAFNVVLDGCLGNAKWQGDVWRGQTIHNGFILAGFGWNGIITHIAQRRHVIWRCDGITFTRFVDLHRFAVEVR